MNAAEVLDPYLPAGIRLEIEQRYYARVNAQAQLEEALHDPNFLASPQSHMALISDHGVVHVRDVAQQILHVLDRITGVLIPFRSAERAAFMRGYGVLAAYVHDIGMVDFSWFGRAMHPECASQWILGPEFDELVSAMWEQSCGGVAELSRRGALAGDPAVVFREMLALTCCHSKSKIPVETLNSPSRLQAAMRDIATSDLHVLYHRAQAEKARWALSLAQQAEEDPVEVDALAVNLRTALSAADAAARTRQCPPLSDQMATAYPDFARDAFGWLTAGDEGGRELVQDVVDTLRALRCADALRSRGTVLKTSGQYELFVDHRTANAICAMRLGEDRLFLVELSNDMIAGGEANVASSELGADGNLRVTFHRGAFQDRATTQRAAYCAALVVNDIQRDVIESFRRSSPVDDALPGGAKISAQIEILLEHVDDNLEFADLVREQLALVSPQAAARVRVVPSLQNAAEMERARYLRAADVDWDDGRRREVLGKIAASGHKTDRIDLHTGFRDVKRITLEPGERLVEAGTPAGFVYVPLGEGLQVIPLGGYEAFRVQPWMPLGLTGVIRGGLRNGTITAEARVELLMIPKDVYLKSWHRTYASPELAGLLSSNAHPNPPPLRQRRE